MTRRLPEVRSGDDTGRMLRLLDFGRKAGIGLCLGLALLSGGMAEAGGSLRIIPDGIPNDGILFVDHARERRSGHGNQALTECANGDIIAFYANTSGELMNGHSNSGWTEYRISRDQGRTWSPPTVLEYSRKAYEDDEFHAVLVGEAVTAANGTVVAFLGRYTTHNWRRTTPAYMLSRDHGRTWSAPRAVDPRADVSRIGREHAAFLHEGTVYVLYDSGSHNSAKDGTGHKLYVSTDNGETFQLRSGLPFEETNWYGTMGVIERGRLVAYSYRGADEQNIQYTVSEDDGYTWSPVETTFLAKSIRNPQLSAKLGDIYLLHGRSGHKGPERGHLVLYTSKDGIHWDEGVFLNKNAVNGPDSYSTNEVIGKFQTAERRWLLIQSSISYDQARVNLHHWMVKPIP